MQFSSVLSLVFATIVAAQDVATLFSKPDFQGETFTISGADDVIGLCNPVAGFTADCDIPYAAYSRDTAATIVNGAFAAFSCAVAIDN